MPNITYRVTVKTLSLSEKVEYYSYMLWSCRQKCLYHVFMVYRNELYIYDSHVVTIVAFYFVGYFEEQVNIYREEMSKVSPTFRENLKVIRKKMKKFVKVKG